MLATFFRTGGPSNYPEDRLAQVRVVDRPDPVEVVSNPQPKDIWHRIVPLTGSYMKVGGELFATVYLHPQSVWRVRCRLLLLAALVLQ